MRTSLFDPRELVAEFARHDADTNGGMGRSDIPHLLRGWQRLAEGLPKKKR